MGRRMGLPSTTADRVSKTTSAVCRLHCHRIGVPGDVPPPMPLRSRDVVFGNGLRWIHGLKGQRCSGGESVGGGCGTPTESGLFELRTRVRSCTCVSSRWLLLASLTKAVARFEGKLKNIRF